jgi:endoglucanase
VSHFKANWVKGSDQWPEPTWPLRVNEKDVWDKERLRKEQIEPWQALARKSVGVHVGEGGAYRFTPHTVALTWLKDFLLLRRL